MTWRLGSGGRCSWSPFDRASETFQGTARDTAARFGEHAIEDRHVTGPFLPHGATHALPVESMAPKVRLDEDIGGVPLARLEHRSAQHPLRDEGRSAQHGRDGAGDADAGGLV